MLSNGLRDVLPFLAAMWLGEALWLTCAVAGLAVAARTLGVVFLVIKFIGVAYLLFLAWKMWFAPTDVSRSELPSGQSPWKMFGAGLTITMFREHDVLPWQGLKSLVPATNRLWRFPDGVPRIPLSYSVRAKKAA